MGRCPHCGVETVPEIATTGSDNEVDVFVCPDCEAILGTHLDERPAIRRALEVAGADTKSPNIPVNGSLSADHLDKRSKHLLTMSRESANHTS